MNNKFYLRQGLILCILAVAVSSASFAKNKATAVEELSDAVFSCDVKRVKSLFEKGVDPNLREIDGDRWPLLGWASAGMCRDLKQGGRGSYKAEPRINKQVLQLLQVFVDHNANVNTLGDDGWSPLMVAIGSVRFNYTPDKKARIAQQKRMVSFLIAAGADVNVQAKDGTTPLILAVEIGEYDTVKMLLEAGADPGAKNKKNQTAADIAKKNGLSKIAKALAAPDSTK